MPFIEIEGMLFNTEDIEAVRNADSNNEGFHTELVLVSGTQLLKTSVGEVIKLIKSAKS
jgi:hypothetical protein